METKIFKNDVLDWDDDNNTTILLACPFCGGEAIQEEDNGMEVCIECKYCKACIYRSQKSPPDIEYDYVKACRIAWNRRHNGYSD